MSYMKPPCLLRDMQQKRLTEKSLFLLELESHQERMRAAKRIEDVSRVTSIRRREQSGR